MYFVYAIFNKKFKKIYIGQTQNLEERLRLHNEKKFIGGYTSRFDGIWQLIYSEKAPARKEALIPHKRKTIKKFQRARVY